MRQTRNALNFLRSQYQGVLTKARILGMAVKYAIPLLFFVPMTCIPPAFAETSYDYWSEYFSDPVKPNGFYAFNGGSYTFAPPSSANSFVIPSASSLITPPVRSPSSTKILTFDEIGNFDREYILVTGTAPSGDRDYQLMQINLDVNDLSTREFDFRDNTIQITGGAASKEGNFLMANVTQSGAAAVTKNIGSLLIDAGDSGGLLIQGHGEGDFVINTDSLVARSGLVKVGGDPSYTGKITINARNMGASSGGLFDVATGSNASAPGQGDVELNIEWLSLNGGKLNLEGGSGVELQRGSVVTHVDELRISKEANLYIIGGDGGVYTGGSSTIVANSFDMDGGHLKIEGGDGGASNGGLAELTLNTIFTDFNSGIIEIKNGENAGFGEAKLIIGRPTRAMIHKDASIINQGTVEVRGVLQIETEDHFNSLLSGNLVLAEGQFDARPLTDQIEVNQDILDEITGNGSVYFNDLSLNVANYSRPDLLLAAEKLSAGQDGVFTVSDGQLQISHGMEILGDNPTGDNGKLEVTGGSVSFKDAREFDLGSFDVASSVADGVSVTSSGWQFANVSVSAPDAISIGNGTNRAELSITDSLDSTAAAGGIKVKNNATLDLANSLDIRVTKYAHGTAGVNVGSASDSINLQQGGMLKIDVSQATTDGSTPVVFRDDYAINLLYALVSNDSEVNVSQLYLIGSTDLNLAKLVERGSGYWSEFYEVTEGVSFDELKNFDLIYKGLEGEEEYIYSNLGSVTSETGNSPIVENGKVLILNGNGKDEYLVAVYDTATQGKIAGDILLGHGSGEATGGAVLTLNGDGLVRDILDGTDHGKTNIVNITADVQGRNIGEPGKPVDVNYVSGSNSSFENVYARNLNSEAGSVAEVTESTYADEAYIAGDFSTKNMDVGKLYSEEGSVAKISELVKANEAHIAGDLSAKDMDVAMLYTEIGSVAEVTDNTDADEAHIAGEFSTKNLKVGKLYSKAGSVANVSELVDADEAYIAGELSTQNMDVNKLYSEPGSVAKVAETSSAEDAYIAGEFSAKNLDVGRLYSEASSVAQITELVAAKEAYLAGTLSTKDMDVDMLYTEVGSVTKVTDHVAAKESYIAGEFSTTNLDTGTLYTEVGSKVNVQGYTSVDQAFINGEMSADTFRFTDLLKVGYDQKSGALYVKNLDTSQGGLICIDPDWSEEPAILTTENLIGGSAPDDMVLGSDLLVAQNSATFIGLDKLGAKFAFAKVKANLHNLKTSWGPDGVGALLYLNKAINVAPGKGIYVTAEDVNQQLLGPVASVGSTTGAAADASTSKPSSLTLNPHSALVISKNAVDTAKDTNAKGAVIAFQDQATVTVQKDSKVLLDGNFKEGDTALVFADVDDQIELSGSGLLNDMIVARTLNGALAGVIGEDGKLSKLKIADDLDQRIGQSSDRWFDIIVASLTEELGDNPSAGSEFINEVATEGDGSEAEVVSRMPSFEGAVQASLMAGQSSNNAVSERLWGIHGLSDVTIAGNGMGSNIWLRPFYQNFNSQDMSANGLPYGVDLDMAGVALGYDFGSSSGFTFGGLFNIGSGSSDGKQLADGVSNDFDYYSLALYGSYNFENWSFLASVAYSEVDNDSSAAFGFADVKSTFDSSSYDVMLAGRYRWDLDSFAITPYLELHYTNLDVDGYEVKDKANDTVIGHSSASSADLFAMPVGVTFDTLYQINDWTIKPSLDLAVIFNFGDNEIENTFAMTGLEHLPVTNQTEVWDDRCYRARAAFGVQKGLFSLNFSVDYTGSENTDSLRFGALASLAF